MPENSSLTSGSNHIKNSVSAELTAGIPVLFFGIYKVLAITGKRGYHNRKVGESGRFM